tara:strand:+ start:4662 stop:5165 length:504 start_codon:yes stop_codon:yes gene_type:complete
MKEFLSRKWLHVILFVSLAVNLFLAGFLVSRAMMPSGHARSHSPHGLSAIARHMSPEDRRELFRHLKRDGHPFRESHEQLARLRQQAMDLLMTENVDRARLEEVLAAEREAHLKIISRVQNALVDRLMAMPLEQRRKIIEETWETLRAKRFKRADNDPRKSPPSPGP